MKLVRTATAFLGHFRSLGVINWVEYERQSAWWLRGNRYFWECIASWHSCLERLFQSSMVHSRVAAESSSWRFIGHAPINASSFSWAVVSRTSFEIRASGLKIYRVVGVSQQKFGACQHHISKPHDMPIGFSTLAWSRGLALSEYWGSKLHR